MKKMIIMILCLVLVSCTKQSDNSTTTQSTTTTTPIVTEKPKSTSGILFDERDALDCEFEVTPNGDIYKVNGICENKLDEEIYVSSMQLLGKDELLFDFKITKGFSVGPKSSYEWSFDSYKYREEFGGFILNSYSYVNGARDTEMYINELSKNSIKSNFTGTIEEEDIISKDFLDYHIFDISFEEADVDYDTVRTIYKFTITNTSNKDYYLDNVNFATDNLYRIGLLVPANSTIQKYYSLHLDTADEDLWSESDKGVAPVIEVYSYFMDDIEYGVDLVSKEASTSKYIAFTSSNEDLSYARRMNNGFTVYAWQENGEWYFDYLEGREYDSNVDDLNVAGIWGDSTIYDYALSTFDGFEENRLYNLIDGEVVVDDAVKTYVETAANELGLDFVYNNDYSNVNIEEYEGIVTMTLHTDENYPGSYLMVTYVQNPYSFTEEEKAKVGSNIYTKEGIVELVNTNVLNQNVYICGKDSPLTSDQKTELYTYFEENNVYASYEGEKEVYVFKPVIYIYGEENTDVHVEVDGDLCISYPLYGDGWDVTIKDGKLVTDDRSYEYLYYEANVDDVFRRDVGFVVAREDSISFLEEKLEILGLNEREMNDMITFWLPYLYQNEYNFISFQSETYSELVPLHVSPTPDTMIRIYMLIDGLEEYKEVKEQVLTPVSREGYTVVEWGGSYLD